MCVFGAYAGHQGNRFPGLELQMVESTCGCWQLNSDPLQKAMSALNFPATSLAPHHFSPFETGSDYVDLVDLELAM